jgi:hypothetical protein
MRTIKLLLGCIIITALSCGMASADLTDVPLVWKADNNALFSDSTTITGLLTHKIKLAPFDDSRPNKQEIGKNIEKAEVRTVTTKDNVAAWCTERMKDILRQYGLSVVENDVTVVIKTELINFYVTESNLYEAIVTLRVSASDPNGKVLWQGLISAQTKRFGRSYKLENYQESLSYAFLDAVKTLLNNQEFNAAILKK